MREVCVVMHVCMCGCVCVYVCVCVCMCVRSGCVSLSAQDRVILL